MARRRRKRNSWVRRTALALAAIPALYLLAALVGSLVPVNRAWQEPERGVTIYLANNGVHADIIMPAVAEGPPGGHSTQNRFHRPDRPQRFSLRSGEERSISNAARASPPAPLVAGGWNG